MYCWSKFNDTITGNHYYTFNLKLTGWLFISTFQLFIKDNQSGDEVTQLDYLGFIGSPVQATNMSDFKRVSHSFSSFTKSSVCAIKK